MGKKGFNWRARQVVNTEIDNASTKKIELEGNTNGHYDASNAFVLPSEKRKTRVKKDKTKVVRILSKSHRKRLEKIVEKKKKKENRQNLLDALAQVQVTPEELNNLVSIASVQTKGLKRHFHEQQFPDKAARKIPKVDQDLLDGVTKINTLSGAKKMCKELLQNDSGKVDDPNVVGFESELSSSDSEDEDKSEHSVNVACKPDDETVNKESSFYILSGDKSSQIEDGPSNGDIKSVQQPVVTKTGTSKQKTSVQTSANKKSSQIEDKYENVEIKSVQQPVVTKTGTSKQKSPVKTPTNKKSSQIEDGPANIDIKSVQQPVVTKTGTSKQKTPVQTPANKKSSQIEDKHENVEVKSVQQPVVTKTGTSRQKTPPQTLHRKKATYIQVARDEDIQIARLKLPILSEEQQIMETINENAIVIIAGETGSGKTTQVPQFLYEAGYASEGKLIGVTEPRRVAAISMSQRVGLEMSLPEQVSFLIRFEGNVSETTKIKFMTDGVLLKEVQNDFLLSEYSVIILDEAHERSVYTDILLGLLSRIVPLRNKKGSSLKLIIMSATLRVEDFTQNERLFRIPPPVLKVEARQFPVTVHFNKRTKDNYLKEAYNKAAKIHCRLPDGGILIFVTGQQEVKLLVSKLRKSFPLKNKDKLLEAQKMSSGKKKGLQKEFDDRFDGLTKKGRRKLKVKVLPKVDLDDYSLPQDQDDDENFEDFEDNEEDPLEDDDDEYTSDQPLWVLPLYSLLEARKQSMVFQPAPIGCRLCVVATNVAETSLTIPGIKYVVDSGKTKVKLYDKVTGVTSYVVHWTSQASADQRAGRAGRTAPGHCYRLYSSAVFNDVFVKFAKPEIQEKPVDDLFLQMKCMNIDKVVNFPFPTAPDLLQLRTASGRLETLGALKDGQVTDLGKAIARFPVLPRYGKMLALSHQHDLLPYTVLLVAALSVQEVLLETPIGERFDVKAIRQKWHATRLRWASSGNSKLLGDPMVLLKAVGAAEYANQQGNLETFCIQNGLRHKAIAEIRKLRHQLTNEVKVNVPEVSLSVDPNMQPPTDLQAKLLRQIILAGMGDQVAKRISPEEVKDDQDKVKYKYAYRAMNMEEPVWLHQGSVLKKELPELVVYQEIYETNKMYMRGVTAIEVEWLVKFVPHLCNLSEPLSEPQPSYNEATGRVHCTVRGSFGSQNWEIPSCSIEYRHALGAYKWFARFLLEGKVFPKLTKYTKTLLSVPATMVKTWANLQKRTDSLLKALMGAKISSREELEDVWEKQPKYLLREYLQWLPESAHGEVTLLWPPL